MLRVSTASDDSKPSRPDLVDLTPLSTKRTR